MVKIPLSKIYSNTDDSSHQVQGLLPATELLGLDRLAIFIKDDKTLFPIHIEYIPDIQGYF